jgi:TatD DNase family protein
VDIAIRPVELPAFGTLLPDTHAHLDMLDDPAGALERAMMSGVGYICCVVDATESPEGAIEHLDTWLADASVRLRDWSIDSSAPVVRLVLGTHPHNAKDYTGAVEAFIAERAGTDARLCAVGEIGLDYHYDYSPRGDQRRAFRAQLALAKRLGLPVVVHLREAYDEGYAILEEIGLPEKGCVLHCFTDGPETARRFLDLGCHISFAGPVTFAKGDAIREAAKVVPLDRLLVETDCPFMAPSPYRGRTNEPAWVTLNAAKIAEVKETDPVELAEAVTANARRIFGAVE